MSTVSIVRATYPNVYEGIKRSIELSGPLDISKHERIVIKLNLCDARTPETGSITHPLFLDGLLNYLRGKHNDIEIFVVESDATVVIADLFIKWFNFESIIRKWEAKWINLSKQNTIEKRIDGKFFKRIDKPEILEDSYFISLAKLKTNLMTTITCCLKNQFGCLPLVEKSVYHPDIDKVIADVNLVMKPNYCIVDGIIAMGGAKGPAFGIPIPAGIIVSGKDVVAVDAVCARIMGFRPQSIKHIREAAVLGVGSLKYEVEGEDVKRVRKDFEISRTEMKILRRVSSLQRQAQLQFRQTWKKYSLDMLVH